MLKMTTALFTLTLAFSNQIVADESSAAHNVQEKCTKCHDTEVYTREDHRMKSLPALGAQVRRCNVNTGAQMFDDEVDDVIDYLNDNFYKFKK